MNEDPYEEGYDAGVKYWRVAVKPNNPYPIGSKYWFIWNGGMFDGLSEKK